MPGENVWSWSTTAANNGSADSSIDWSEGMERRLVNNSARSNMAAFAKFRDLSNGSITTGGSANAQTFVTGMNFTAVPSGMRVMLTMGYAPTASCALIMDSIATVFIHNMLGNTLSGGEWAAGDYCEFLYDGSNWILLEPVGGSRLLTHIVADTAAALEFEDGISSAYDEVKLVVSNVTVSAGSTALWLRISTDAGVTFKAGATDYTWARNDLTGDGVTGSNSADSLTSTHIRLTPLSLSNNTTYALSGEVRLLSPHRSAINQIQWDMSFYNGSVMCLSTGCGAYMTATPTDAFRILPSSGTVSGSFQLYGIKK